MAFKHYFTHPLYLEKVRQKEKEMDDEFDKIIKGKEFALEHQYDLWSRVYIAALSMDSPKKVADKAMSDFYKSFKIVGVKK